jgi:PhoPQ-activated pathogenicity-related protein
MRDESNWLLLIVCLTCLLLTTFPGQALDPKPPTALFDYIKRPEPKFSWKLLSKTPGVLGTVYDIELVSQEWHDITWKHSLQVYQAPGVKPARTMLIWNTGGQPSLPGAAFGMELSRKVQAPVAFLYNIPNQPLLGGKTEDALIAETFVRCLADHDTTWPLLFPMTKSLVKAMDALQAFGKEELKLEPKQFVISGASKRGWTTWLTAAVDPRVKAIAPLVIDTLNMQEQLKHQKESFGAYSEMIRDYTERKLIPLPPGEEARQLWLMVDPYTYRDRYKMPKLIINANNDPYWTVDALQLYWDELPGEKWVTYIPNAGHNLRQKNTPRGEELSKTINALAAFTRAQISNQALPQLDWKFETNGEKVRLVVHAKPAPLGARLWVSDAETADFRKSVWKEQPATQEEGKIVGSIDRPAKGYRAFWAELDYEIDGIRYTLGTQVRVVGKP